MTIPIVMPTAEVVDRYTIALLKRERATEDDPDKLEQQVKFYAAGIDFSNLHLLELLEDLHEINGLLWDTEGAIRRGEEDTLSADEICRLALRVRDLNRKRCAIKNLIIDLTGEGFREMKVNYAGG